MLPIGSIYVRSASFTKQGTLGENDKSSMGVNKHDQLYQASFTPSLTIYAFQFQQLACHTHWNQQPLLKQFEQALPSQLHLNL